MKETDEAMFYTFNYENTEQQWPQIFSEEGKDIKARYTKTLTKAMPT